MRQALAIVGILGVLGLVSVAARQAEAPAAGQMCRLKVTGMHCGQCAKAVEKAAAQVDGVIAATASQPKGSAEVRYDPAKTTPEAIAKAITKRTGFKAEAGQQDR